MDGLTILVVLGCAASTALLNCGLRHQRDPLAAAFLVAIGGAAVALPALFLTGLPGIGSAPYLLVSTVLGSIYWLFLGRAYASGEISIVFPLAYGSAPIWILMLSGSVFGETLTANQLAVVLLISAGLLLVLFSSADKLTKLNLHVLINSVAVTAIICAYTLCDALAVRKTGSPIAYTVFMYASSGLMVLAYALRFHSGRLLAAFSVNRFAGLLWGALSLVNYCGELWAMTRAPVALVAAMRESSILFAVVIAILWLKEPLNPSRMAGAGVVAFGLMLMRLA
ncbi:MAG: DMT family transporter [Rhizobiaceae bacterium]